MKKQSTNLFRKGFTVIEVVVSLMIVSLICSSVLMVVKEQMVRLGESRLKMEAFEVARENMENLLTAKSISEMTDYGTSDKNLNIEWETIVEPFSAEGSSKMWVRAICSATYSDANGQSQKVELTHWLTDISDSLVKQMMEDKEKLDDINEPNMPEDANDVIPLEESGSDTPGQNIDPAAQKIFDELLKKQ